LAQFFLIKSREKCLYCIVLFIFQYRFVQIIMCSSQYPGFLDHMMKIFLKILQEGEPHFISEYNIQQVRKLILEMIHRIPSNDYLRPYVRSILTLMSRLLETDNEENVLVCLRIIIELHKQYKPTFNPDVSNFYNSNSHISKI